MGFEADLLARALQKLSAALAEAREQRSRRQLDLASKTLGDAWQAVFNLDRRFLQMMQPAQIVTVVPDPRRQRGVVELLTEEADLLKQQGDLDSAAATAKWAIGIVDAAKLHGFDQELRALLLRLRALVALGQP